MPKPSDSSDSSGSSASSASSEPLIPDAPIGPKGVPTFTVFVTQSCTWCHRTMQFLEALGEQRGGFKLAAIDATESQDLFRRVVQQTGRTTVPQIFLDQNFVGGWDDLSRAAREGKLDAFLSGEEIPPPPATPESKRRRWRLGRRADA